MGPLGVFRQRVRRLGNTKVAWVVALSDGRVAGGERIRLTRIVVGQAVGLK